MNTVAELMERAEIQGYLTTGDILEVLPEAEDSMEQLEEILKKAKPPVKEDVVYVYAVVEGWENERLFRNEYFKAFHPIEIEGRQWRAISWTTAASLAAVVEMVAAGTLPQQGFIKQEEIPLEAFQKTHNGQYFLQES